MILSDDMQPAFVHDQATGLWHSAKRPDVGLTREEVVASCVQALIDLGARPELVDWLKILNSGK
jgi:hypothetical protein